MRYICPDACAGITHAGVTLTRSSDGTIEAEAEAAAALAPHGLVPVEAVAREDKEPARSRHRIDDRRMLR